MKPPIVFTRDDHTLDQPTSIRLGREINRRLNRAVVVMYANSARSVLDGEPPPRTVTAALRLAVSVGIAVIEKRLGIAGDREMYPDLTAKMVKGIIEKADGEAPKFFGVGLEHKLNIDHYDKEWMEEFPTDGSSTEDSRDNSTLDVPLPLDDQQEYREPKSFLEEEEE